MAKSASGSPPPMRVAKRGKEIVRRHQRSCEKVGDTERQRDEDGDRERDRDERKTTLRECQCVYKSRSPWTGLFRRQAGRRRLTVLEQFSKTLLPRSHVALDSTTVHQYHTLLFEVDEGTPLHKKHLCAGSAGSQLPMQLCDSAAVRAHRRPVAPVRMLGGGLERPMACSHGGRLAQGLQSRRQTITCENHAKYVYSRPCCMNTFWGRPDTTGNETKRNKMMYYLVIPASSAPPRWAPSRAPRPAGRRRRRSACSMLTGPPHQPRRWRSPASSTGGATAAAPGAARRRRRRQQPKRRRGGRGGGSRGGSRGGGGDERFRRGWRRRWWR